MAGHPTFREAFRFWLKLGFISFGGPAGQIALMQQELVERKKWIGQQRFLHALNFCMLLPGPEAQQLAIYCGWLLHRTWGGIVAGVLFVLPSAFLLWALSVVYVFYGHIGWLAAVFHGLKPAVVAIVVAAVLRIGKKSLHNAPLWAIAITAFALVFFLKTPFPLIVVGALLVGWIGARLAPEVFAPMGGGLGVRAGASSPADITERVTERAVIADAAWHCGVLPTMRRAVRVVTVCVVLWFAPVGVIGVLLGWHSVWVNQAVFFSKAAMVTFGGAYAVLPYVAQHAVETHGWLAAPQMLDGLAFAETTPGPLIMVLQFVGFLGGWNQPGALSPLASASLGAAITTWVTFVPCFLWIFLGAPHIEQLRGNNQLAGALSAVTASVAGVILNLAVWFGWQVLVPGGSWASVDWLAVGLVVGAFVALHRFRANVVAVIAASGLIGLLAA
ncbi:MAG: chromate efflux transporter [Opitutus sp.]|nr:chromate efflux transporter [Opitutus sp.]MCS6246746.1 chromate efflux transporter [Opitutus sp.]MCS6273292.1 chromate efflux transporter [Opitutus sp.]MCS6276170.1 chromate efflux transporter [Opitutus sp.]MCS6301264.1 chromate efflux transporter [Opitutus sp.]